MGHYVSDVDRMFRSVVYQQKTSSEIRDAMQAKVKRIAELLTERAERVGDICNNFEISDQQLSNLILQYQDGGSSFVSFESQGEESKVVPAGAIANIIQEKKMAESERSQLRKLELVIRNLQDVEYYEHPESGVLLTRDCIHNLSDDDLEYLGF